MNWLKGQKNKKKESHSTKHNDATSSKPHKRSHSAMSTFSVSTPKRTPTGLSEIDEFAQSQPDNLKLSMEQKEQFKSEFPDLNNRRRTASFAKHLNEYIANDANDLDAVVAAMTSEIQPFDENTATDDYNISGPPALSSNSTYKARMSHYEQNKRVRRGTIDKLKKQLAKEEQSKTSNHSHKKKYKIRSQSPYKRRNISSTSPKKAFAFDEDDDEDTEEPMPSQNAVLNQQTVSVDSINYGKGDNKTIVINENSNFIQNNSINLHFNSNVNNNLHKKSNHNHQRYASATSVDTFVTDKSLNEWYKFLISVHEYLSVHIQYYPLIEQEIPFCYDEDVNDPHATERTLINQMKYWIERYGVTAMIAHQEVFKLKQDLIKINEEANTLEDESVHLTQKVFTLEYEIGELLKQMKEMYTMNTRYKTEIDNLKNSIAIPPPPPVIKHSNTSPIQIRQSFSPHSAEYNKGSPVSVSPPGSFNEDDDGTPPPPNMDHVYRQKSSPNTGIKRLPPKKKFTQKKHKNKSATVMSFDSESNDMNYRMRSLQKQESVESNVEMIDYSEQYEQIQRKNEELAKEKDKMMKEKDVLMDELDTIKNKNNLLDETNVSLQKEVMELRKLLLRNDISIDLTTKKKKKQKKDSISDKYVNENLKEVIKTMSQQKYIWESEKTKLKQEVAVLTERLKLCQCTTTTQDIEQNVPLKSPQSRKRDESFANRLTQFGDAKDLDVVVASMEDEDVINRSKFGSFALNLNKFANTEHGDLDEVLSAMQNDKHIARVRIGSFAHSLNKFVDNDVGSLDAVINDIHSPDLQTKVSIKTDVSLNENEIKRLEYMEKDEMKNAKDDIIANIEIDEYENSDDGWVSEEEKENKIIKKEELPTKPKHKSSFWRQQSAKIVIREVVIPANQLRRESVANKTGNSSPLIPAEPGSPGHEEVGVNSLLSKYIAPNVPINNPKPFKKREIKTKTQRRVPSRPPPQIIANIKRTKQRRFNPTRHGPLSVASSNLWSNEIINQQPTFYAAIDGLPSSTNIDKEEPEWKKRKNNDVLVPFLCFFKNKKDFENLVKFSKHASVRDIAFQTNFASFCNGFIRLDLSAIHWKIKDLLQSIDTNEDEMNYQDQKCGFYVASNVDDAQITHIHSFFCEDKKTRNQWLSSLQSLINKRKDSTHRRNMRGNAHQNPSTGRYKMKLY